MLVIFIQLKMEIEEKKWLEEKQLEELLNKELTLKHVDTVDVLPSPLYKVATDVIKSTIRSTEEVILEMKKWLREGITPDGTRMISNNSWQWYQDYYQSTAAEMRHNDTLKSGKDNDSENGDGFPTDLLVDYYYWTTPYMSHIGEIKLVMMHSQVNFLKDGTHAPSDRLQINLDAYKDSRYVRNIQMKAKKRLEVEKRHAKVIRESESQTVHRKENIRMDNYEVQLAKPNF